MPTRRDLLRLALRGGVAAALAAALPGVAFAAAGGERRFVVVILRGALDGLALLPPHGDPAYAAARGPIAIAPPGTADGALPLDATFGLHPALAQLHAAYRAGELLPIHAVATAYRERSHFDGQNVLENGGDAPSGSASGWLNRALLARGDRGEAGLAIGQNVPLILRGPLAVGSWAPSALPEVEPELLARLRDLYSDDATLAARLDEATELDALLPTAMPAGGGTPGGAARGMRAADAGARGRGNVERLRSIANSAGRLLAAPSGPRVAVLDSLGWDTHANEGGAEGQLALRLRGLEAALLALRDGLGAAWPQSAVLVCTEFGRTVETNGTRGTDHGTGAAALLYGGAVRGGRVLADWPGLAPSARHEGRDLRPTLDLRALAKGVLRDHLGVAERALGEVFPGTGRLAPVADLVRA